MLRQGRGIRTPGHEIADDAQPRDAGDIRNHEGRLEVHQDEGLLHPMDVCRRTVHERVTMPQIRAERDDPVGRSDTSAQQADTVSFAPPLTVEDVALSARHVLHMPCVDEQHLTPAGLEDFVERNPVHAGGFHRHTG